MAPDLSTGSVFAGYRIEELVGEGGMGVVYRAFQEKLGRRVALKLIRPEHAADELFRLRFQRESRLAIELEHPNVIPVYEAGEAGRALFISMRYVRGPNLRERLVEVGRLPGRQAAEIVAQIASALDAAHERGLVHRDVKPGNVLLQPQSGSVHAYLTDFGLIKHSSSDTGLTGTGQWVGTLDYLSPEQINGEQVDARADVYALGCVLYELLTGRVPFPHGTDIRKMWAHVNEPPPVASALEPQTQGSFDQIVARAMAKQPADRFESAGDLGRAALAAARGEPPPPELGRVDVHLAREQPADQWATTKGDGGSVAVPSVSRRGLRRTVTVVSCEAIAPPGSDPEAVRHAMSSAGELMSTTLARHGGTVQSDLGDAVVAVFGLPRVREDDALRAVLAVHELRTRPASLKDLDTAPTLSLELRAGVDTGVVVTGDPARGEPAVNGEPMTTARRLSQAAAHGQVLLTRATHHLVRGAVTVEHVEAVASPKGAGPISPFELRDVDPHAQGIPRRLDSPIVARDRELELLNQLFQQVKKGSFQLTTILGDAGVGKSRLTREFLRGLDDRIATFTGRCPPYGEGITFWPVAEVIRAAAGITTQDSPVDARTKIAALLTHDEDAELIVARLSAVLGLSAGSAPAEELFWAIRRLLEAVASDGPLVVVFDDIHQGERKFIELLEYLDTSDPRAPILILCLGRLRELRERHPSHSGLAQRFPPLKPLDGPARGALVRNLLGATSVAKEVSEHVAEASAGNPLFLEEMVRMLVDDGLVEPQDGGWRATGDLSAVKIPPTIKTLIEARLERLELEEQSVLERAAVIGQSFPRSALRELLPEAGRRDLGYRLDALVGKQLVEPRHQAFIDEDGYRFTHILIRDGAYDRIPRITRAELHESFAAWLDRRLGQRSHEYDELTGHHLERAFLDREVVNAVDGRAQELATGAAARLASAGARARMRGDMPAAANLIGRAESLLPAGASKRELQLAQGLVIAERGDEGDAAHAADCLARVAREASEAGDTKVELRASLESSYWQLASGATENIDGLHNAARAATEALGVLGDDVGLSRAWNHMAFVDSIAGRWAVAARSLEKALRHARLAGDAHEEIDVLWFLTGALQYGPIPAEKGIRRLERLLAPLRKHATGREPPSAKQRALVEATGLAGLEAMRGELERARNLSAAAKALCDETGQKLKRATLRQVTARVALLAEEPADAEVDLRRSSEILEEMGEIGFLSTTAALLAEAQYAQGDLDAALETTRTVERRAADEDIEPQVLWRATRAKVAARTGDVEGGRTLVPEAVALAAKTDYLNLRADSQIALAVVASAEGRHDETRAGIARAVKLYERKGNVVAAGRAIALGDDLTRRSASGRPLGTGASKRH
jgi:serine/threonine protein kinase